MSASRRNFLKNTAAGIAGAALSGSLTALQPSPIFYTSGEYSSQPANTTAAIRKCRIRDIEIQLLDSTRKPLKNIPVEVTLPNHAFLFGDIVWR